MKITIERIIIEIDEKEAADILRGAEHQPEMEKIKKCVLTDLAEGLKKYVPAAPVRTPEELG